MSEEPKFDESGPAFPTADESGMTLRDYFAACALQGLPRSSYNGTACCMAEKAYEIAEAMLRARIIK